MKTKQIRGKIKLFEIKNKIQILITSLKLKIQENKVEKMILSGQIQDFNKDEFVCLGEIYSIKLVSKIFGIKVGNDINKLYIKNICINKDGCLYLKEKSAMKKIGSLESLYIYNFDDSWQNVTARNIYDWTGFLVKGILLSKYEIEKHNNQFFANLVLERSY